MGSGFGWIGTIIKELLRDSRYLAFWISQVGSHLGNGLTLVALASQVIWSYGAAAYGLVLAVTAGAMSIVMLFGGVAADRYSRTRMMIVGDVACIVGVGGYFAFGPGGSLALLLASAALMGLGTGFYEPAHRAALPQLVPEHLRQQANAIDSGTKRLAGAAGAALGGLLVALGSVQMAYLTDAVTYVISVVALTRIALPQVSGGEGTDEDEEGLWREITGGLSEVARRPWIAIIMAQGTLQMFLVYGPLFALIPVVAEKRYNEGAFGILSACQLVGAMIGSVIAGRLRTRRPGVTAMHGLAPSAAVSLCLAFAVPLWLFAVVSVVAWAGISVFIVLWYTALQNEIPKDRQGRVFSLEGIASFGLQPFALALAPILALTVGYTYLGVAGAVLMLVSSYGLLVHRNIRDLASPKPSATATNS